jgi:hypothetical protein
MTTTPGVGGMPAWAYACGACVRAKEDDGKSQRLSRTGSPSPSKRAGANPNPGLTLALVCTESPTMSRGGHSKASAAPQGREECPRDPRSQAVGPPEAERRGENGGVTILKEVAVQNVDRMLVPESNVTRTYRQRESTAHELDEPSTDPPHHPRCYTRPRRLPPACRPSQRC